MGRTGRTSFAKAYGPRMTLPEQGSLDHDSQNYPTGKGLMQVRKLVEASLTQVAAASLKTENLAVRKAKSPQGTLRPVPDAPSQLLKSSENSRLPSSFSMTWLGATTASSFAIEYCGCYLNTLNTECEEETGRGM